MNYATLISPSRKLCLVMALAAGMTAIPLPTMAGQAVHNVQQSGVLKGQVTDKSGEPIIGATVKVKDSNIGTVTDFDGNFELKNVPSGGVITVSYIGYTTKDVSFRAGQTLNVQIAEDSETQIGRAHV